MREDARILRLGRAIPSRGFAPYLIPMEPDPADMRHLGTSPSGTALFFRVLGRNKSLGEYQLYIEANFSGYQYLGFQLKKAYAIINDFTIGYASSTFSDPAALPLLSTHKVPTTRYRQPRYSCAICIHSKTGGQQRYQSRHRKTQ